MGSADYVPNLGETVELEVEPGLVVRHPKTGRKLETGNSVTWSTYYIRRQREGAIRPRRVAESPASPAPEESER